MKILRSTVATVAAAGLLVPPVINFFEDAMCKDDRPFIECRYDRASPVNVPVRPNMLPPAQLQGVSLTSTATMASMDWYVPWSEPMRPAPTTYTGIIIGPHQDG